MPQKLNCKNDNNCVMNKLLYNKICKDANNECVEITCKNNDKRESENIYISKQADKRTEGQKN